MMEDMAEQMFLHLNPCASNHSKAESLERELMTCYSTPTVGCFFEYVLKSSKRCIMVI